MSEDEDNTGARISQDHLCEDAQERWPKLSKRQLAWLRFHAEAPAPHRWAWRTVDDRDVDGAPETWRRLRAWKSVGGKTHTAAIWDTDRDALDAYFTEGFPRVNDAGRELLAARTLGLAHTLPSDNGDPT